MDIINEIRRLPNFGYVFLGDDGKEHIAVLGGYSTPKVETYEYPSNILYISDKMLNIYSQAELSVADKTELATLMKKMYSVCEARQVGLYSGEEQGNYINHLSSNEKAQVSQQVQMHKDCRIFYRDYIHR